MPDRGIDRRSQEVRRVNPVDDSSPTADNPAIVGLIFASVLIVVGALHMLLAAFL